MPDPSTLVAMPPYRDHPYVRRYGHLAGPAVFAPMFVIAIAGFLIGLLVMIPTALVTSRTTVALGVPGEAIPLVWQGKGPASLTVVSSTPVAKDAATCVLHRADGSVDRWGTEWIAARSFVLDGATWHTVAELSSPDSGESFTCTGEGLGELRAVRDRTVESWATVAVLAFGVVASAGMTAVGFAMRRTADAERR